MTNLVKLIKGLKAHLNLDANCSNCPYLGGPGCLDSLMNDALKALTEQISEIERLEVEIDIDDIYMVVHDLEQCEVRHYCSGCSRDNTHADARCIHELLTAAKIVIEALLRKGADME